MPQIFRPVRSHYIGLAVFVLPAAVLFGILGILLLVSKALGGSLIAITMGLVFIFFAAGSLLAVVYHMSVQVELTSSEVVRRSIFGTKSMPLNDVVSALFSSVRSVTFLTVRTATPQTFMSLSTHAFSREQLQQIQAFLISEAQKAHRPFQSTVTTGNKTMINLMAVEILLIAAVFACAAVAGIHHVRTMQTAHQNSKGR